MTEALEDGEWSAARPGRTLPPGKDPVPILHEAGWAPGPVWTGAENLVPTGIRSRTVQPIVSRYADWATGSTRHIYRPLNILRTQHLFSKTLIWSYVFRLFTDIRKSVFSVFFFFAFVKLKDKSCRDSTKRLLDRVSRYWHHWGICNLSFINIISHKDYTSLL